MLTWLGNLTRDVISFLASCYLTALVLSLIVSACVSGGRELLVISASTFPNHRQKLLRATMAVVCALLRALGTGSGVRRRHNIAMARLRSQLSVQLNLDVHVLCPGDNNCPTCGGA